jgi:hypothetical protein
MVQGDQSERFGVGAAQLRQISDSIDTEGHWEHYVEVRMGAGFTMHIERISEQSVDPMDHDYKVMVVWGSQKAEALLRSIERAVEVAYRLGHDFYEIRRDSHGEVR